MAEAAPVEERRRVVYSLGLPPERIERWEPGIETGVEYPEAGETKAAEGDGGMFSDGAYQSLLRRFDADARQLSQLTAEEEMF
jgi:hypothetical protein